jgi:cobalt ECF transporter T component CbiQ
MNQLPAFLTARPSHEPHKPSREAVRVPFLEKGIRHLARIVQDEYAHWEGSRRDGFLQGVDPRVKVLFLVFFLIVISLKREILPMAGIFGLVFLLFVASRLDVLPLYRRILALGLLFGVLVPLPSLLNFFSGGELILPLVHLPREYHLWLYHVPATIGVTREGLNGIALLSLRVTNSVALSMLILHTTTFPDLIKALRVFRVPESFVTVIILSYKYAFAFTRTIEEMHLAKKSRLLGTLDASQSRRWAAGRMAFLFQKTQRRCEDIYKAMVSRGCENHVKLHKFPKMTTRDWAAALTVLLAGVCFLLW